MSGHFGGDGSTEALDQLRSVAPDIRCTQCDTATLLGAPLFSSGIKNSLGSKIQALQRFTSNLASLRSHDALFLLKIV